MARGGRSITSMSRKELIYLIWDISRGTRQENFSSTIVSENRNTLENTTVRAQEGSATEPIRPAVLTETVTVSSGNRLTINSGAELDIRS